MIQRETERIARKGIDNKHFLTRVENLLSIPTDLNLSNEISKEIMNEAELILHGTYNLLGSGDIVLNPVDWHTDFKASFRWNPGKFYKKYKQEGIDSDSDVKVPRELSRCHHLLKAGVSYRNFKNKKYADFCYDQMINWLTENPLMFSINWGCTMDVSIRAVNWIWTLGLLSTSGNIDEKKIEKIKASLYQHGWYIYRNPEKGVNNNHNHYLADLAGQIHLGLIFSQLEEPQKWLEKGKQELFREIRMQILPSGVSYERSTNYNRLVLELILVPVLLLKWAGHEIPSDIWYRLYKMFDFILFSLKPDGTSPVIGDQDNGRLLPFGCEPILDFRYLLSLGAVLFYNSDFKLKGDGFNIYCSLLGRTEAKKIWNNISESNLNLSSRPFPDAGFYIMRKDGNYLFANISGKSLFPELGTGTHTHSDLLSFELVSDGKTFLVDPGSYVYTADADERMNFRSTRMHNTLTVDGESQNVLKREILWDFERNAIPEVHIWSSDERKDILVAGHTGYCRLKEPVKHIRTFCFEKEQPMWIITDEIKGTGKHLFEWFFHFDTGIDFDILESSVKTNCSDQHNIELSFTGISDLKFRKEDSYISKSYGIRKTAKVLVVEVLSEAPQKLVIVIKRVI
jgi:hypothetical protein